MLCWGMHVHMWFKLACSCTCYVTDLRWHPGIQHNEETAHDCQSASPCTLAVGALSNASKKLSTVSIMQLVRHQAGTTLLTAAAGRLLDHDAVLSRRGRLRGRAAVLHHALGDHRAPSPYLHNHTVSTVHSTMSAFDTSVSEHDCAALCAHNK